MKSKILLRISAVLIAIHAIGHSVGFLSWKDHVNATYDEVVKQMTGPKFPFMGASHSLGDYYDGFGLVITLALILCSWFLFMAANMTDDDHRSIATRMLLPLSAYLVGQGIIEIIYFFPFAAGLSLLAAALAIVVMFQLMRAD